MQGHSQKNAWRKIQREKNKEIHKKKQENSMEKHIKKENKRIYLKQSLEKEKKLQTQRYQ